MRPTLLLFLLTAVLLGQDAPAPETRDERVQVVLRNGHSLIGIARAGVRRERLVRGNFKPCSDPADRSSGIRVWYYQDLDGYIFLETRHLERVDVLGNLTAEESRALGEAIAAAHGTRVTGSSSRPAARGEVGASSRPTPVADSFGMTGEERALLDRFPPDRGWSPEKFGELQRKKIVLHVNPSTEEQTFIDQFPTFQTAWKKWLATQPAATVEDAPKSKR
jgi:hypothetical protein